MERRKELLTAVEAQSPAAFISFVQTAVRAADDAHALTDALQTEVPRL